MKTTIRASIIGSLIGMLGFVGCKSEEAFYSNILRSDVFYQLYDDTSFDFLWVMDNSGSMKAHRDFVRDNLSTFVNILTSRKAVDYQMSVVDTDLFSHNGQLVTGAGGITVVKSTASANPIADFASIINNVSDSPTSFWEQGLESAYQAIYQHKAEFSRPGVPLVVVMLTDEQDWSCADQCFGVEPENNTNWIPFPVSRYVDYFKNVKKAEDTDLHVFPIVGIENHPCVVASYGTRYAEVAAGIDSDPDGDKGSVGDTRSICSSEIRESYENIARIIADRGAVFQLSSAASGSGINIFVDGVLVPFSPENYVFEAETNSIVFTGAVPKKGSIIEVTYAEKVN